MSEVRHMITQLSNTTPAGTFADGAALVRRVLERDMADDRESPFFDKNAYLDVIQLAKNASKDKLKDMTNLNLWGNKLSQTAQIASVNGVPVLDKFGKPNVKASTDLVVYSPNYLDLLKPPAPEIS